MKNSRYLITGITGFVGSHMADFLLKKEPSCTIYASRRWRSRDENIKHLYGNERVQFIEADLLDRGSLERLIGLSKPDVVFHFAAQSFPETSFIYPVHTLNTNTIGTTNFLDELRLAKFKGVCNPIIINVSSSEVYGMPKEDEIPIKETNPLRAANPYSISKVGQDLIGQYYSQAYNLKIITTRMFSHEGSRRGKKFALSSFAHQIVMNEKSYYGSGFFPIRVGNLDSIRTYAHIDDAVYAYYLCAIKGVIGDVYNIGGWETKTVGEALQLLLEKSKILKDKFTIILDLDKIRPTDITLQIPDCTKFKNVTGWEPKKGLNEITTDLLDYWRNNV
ncbi:MAG: GDP-mannose 4,6-dehydratase [Novosphingobium sp.]|nr:GDP-mannose 4,6-dehydratase [Novosphingobium sp.]